MGQLQKVKWLGGTVAEGKMGGWDSCRRSNGWAGQLQKVKWVGGAVAEGQMHSW